MKAVPNIPLNIADVRDVADLHIRAMTNPEANGERFIATSDGQISLPEIAALLKNKRPKVSEKVSLKKIPDWMINLLALFNKKAKEASMLLKVNRNVSNAKAKKILSWSPAATLEQTILASVDSLIKHDLIK
jgi:nucleoside-diphosphate-sugar epimerase